MYTSFPFFPELGFFFASIVQRSLFCVCVVRRTKVGSCRCCRSLQRGNFFGVNFFPSFKDPRARRKCNQSQGREIFARFWKKKKKSTTSWSQFLSCILPNTTRRKIIEPSLKKKCLASCYKRSACMFRRKRSLAKKKATTLLPLPSKLRSEWRWRRFKVKRPNKSHMGMVRRREARRFTRRPLEAKKLLNKLSYTIFFWSHFHKLKIIFLCKDCPKSFKF